MGLLDFLKNMKGQKVVKKIEGPLWGHMVNEYNIDVDTLANVMRLVEREGDADGNEPATFVRIFKMSDVEQKGIEIEGWETFDEHSDLVRFEGYVTQSNEVCLEQRNN